MVAKAMPSKIGDEVPPVAQTMDIGTLRLYSGWFPGAGRDQYTIGQHTDAEAAAKVGRPRPIAQGLHVGGLLQESLIGAYGTHWLTSGRLGWRCISMILEDDVITTHGTVTGTAQEGASSRVDLEVWCENQRGAKVLVGTASVLLPSGESA